MFICIHIAHNTRIILSARFGHCFFWTNSSAVATTPTTRSSGLKGGVVWRLNGRTDYSSLSLSTLSTAWIDSARGAVRWIRNNFIRGMPPGAQFRAQEKGKKGCGEFKIKRLPFVSLVIIVITNPFDQIWFNFKCFKWYSEGVVCRSLRRDLPDVARSYFGWVRILKQCLHTVQARRQVRPTWSLKRPSQCERHIHDKRMY